ncbi:MAG: hypothetical protein ACRDLD_16990, partial [Thermoleophilaceae bacterium]
LALALPAAYALDRKGVQLLHPPELAALDVPPGDGVRAEPREARALERLSAYVRDRVPPGEPVFVANPRHDRVRVGNPLVSVLVGRPNPTRYPIMQPGVVTEPDVQREMVRDIERSDTALVVRWLSPVASEREPNDSGRESGARLLDRHLRSAFRPARRFGDYEVLVRRDRRGGPTLAD